MCCVFMFMRNVTMYWFAMFTRRTVGGCVTQQLPSANSVGYFKCDRQTLEKYMKQNALKISPYVVSKLRYIFYRLYLSILCTVKTQTFNEIHNTQDIMAPYDVYAMKTFADIYWLNFFSRRFVPDRCTHTHIHTNISRNNGTE